MTEKELHERKARANTLKVFQAKESDDYYVASSDGTKLYRIQSEDGKARCSCPDYIQHAKAGEEWACKHILALSQVQQMEVMEYVEARKEEMMEGPKINRQLLEQPFPPELIKQRKGKAGRTFDYIEGHAVIKRLNDAFEGLWSFEVTGYQIEKEIGEVYVLGKLEAAGQAKMAFGASELTKDKETNEILSLGDDLKAAATDALKKAATLFGVGLHLYDDRRPQGIGKTEPAVQKSQAASRPSHKLLTDLYSLAKEKGVSYKELESRAIFLFEKRPARLTSEEIKQLMEDLHAG